MRFGGPEDAGGFPRENTILVLTLGQSDWQSCAFETCVGVCVWSLTWATAGISKCDLFLQVEAAFPRVTVS